MRVSARVTEVGSRPIASMLHSLHGVMTGAGARLVDLKRGQPIQVQKFEEFRFNTFEASMVCMNALRSAQQPHPSLSKVWNSSGKKALAQGLVTADWATLAAAMEQAMLPSSGRTNASVMAKTLVTWCKVQEYEEFRFNTFEVAMVCMNALRRVHPTPPGSGSMWNSSGKKVIAQGLVTADWATLAAAIQQAVRSGPSWQHIGPVLTAIMAVDPAPKVSVYR
ncbi:hypothetical protein HaLaN_24073 [Haematococcus lacustris]|uniref:Uncharacterized protein n=1 Tax=Haematococcus lacustris TaxID=44745 RepID=A0A699ZTK5_HAELA|nr:hypothetical protein HaLaN_24073 [Haematococcus lacustris]